MKGLKPLLATTALTLLTLFEANALVIDTNNDIVRSSQVSSTPIIFKTDPSKETVVEVSGTGAGTMKVSTNYAAVPTDLRVAQPK